MEPETKKSNLTSTSVVGNKFNQNGTYRNYLGNTIICHLDSKQPIYDLLVKSQEIYKKASFAKKLIFLPPESFHMTIMPLFSCKFDDKKSHKIDTIDAEINEVLQKNHRFLTNCKPNAQSDLSFKANKIIGKKTIIVQLIPEKQQLSNKLRQFHKNIGKILNCELKPGYSFHISLAYILNTLSDEEVKQKLHLDHQVKKIVNGRNVHFSHWEFCVFEDMKKFVKYENADTRKKLKKQRNYN